MKPLSDEYLKILDTDFAALYQQDPRQAEDHMVALICDPCLTAKWIVKLIRQELISDILSEERDKDISSFDHIIEVLGELGPLPALRSQRVTFDDLVKLSLDPRALRLAHKAVCEIDFDPIIKEIGGE